MPMITLPNGQKVNIPYTQGGAQYQGLGSGIAGATQTGSNGQQFYNQMQPPQQMQSFSTGLPITNLGGLDAAGNPTNGGINPNGMYTGGQQQQPPPQTGAQNTAGVQAQAPDYSGQINQTFQQNLGRAATPQDIAFYQNAMANGLSPNELAGQVGATTEGQNYQMMQNQANTMAQAQQQGMNQAATAPPTGLIGGEQALSQGLAATLQGIDLGTRGAGGILRSSTGDAGIQIARGQSMVRPYNETGQGANRLLGALLGSQGQDAQAQAYNDFQSSPGQQFLQQEGERALLRNQAAIGGLGGGNVRRELTQFGTGLAAQELNNRIAQLGQLSGQGLQGAGLAANLAAQGAQLAQQGGVAQASNFASGGLAAAQAAQQAGRDIATQRFQTGRDIANAVSGTTSALSNLAEEQGVQQANVVGAGGANIANLMSGFGNLDAASQQALATALGSWAVGQGTNQATIQNQIAKSDAAAITGQAGAINNTLKALFPSADFSSALPGGGS